jgi:S1-C subfamily serine protease
MRHPLFLASAVWLLAAPLSALAGDQGEEAIQESVVKITATVRNPDPTKPWIKANPQDISGTGVVIKGKRILTNAHMALYASQMFVQPHQSSEKLAASVESISPGMDLAVLKLEDESFFEKRAPLKLATELPQVKATVLVYGYPTGGSSLSITKGIVSRIEFAAYNYGVAGVRIQVDAAINPGNSGGPALVDGRMIGLIFSKLREADNIGYIIPADEIDLFLKDAADGTYDGKPAMRDDLQTLENDALRSKLGLDKKTQGMVVTEPYISSDAYPLKKWDLITKIGDHPVDDTGMVQVRDDLQLRFQYFVQKLARENTVQLTVLRDGKTIEIALPVSIRGDDLVTNLQGKYPSYFVYGPLVFEPVTNEFLSGFDRVGDRFYAMLSVIRSPLVTRRGDRRKFDGEELVVVPSPMFPHRIAKGYSNPFMKVVKEINGIPVRNLRHLVEILRDTKEKYITISFDDRNNETLVFDRKEVQSTSDDILNDNGVRRPSSDDLVSLWEKKP